MPEMRQLQSYTIPGCLIVILVLAKLFRKKKYLQEIKNMDLFDGVAALVVVVVVVVGEGGNLTIPENAEDFLVGVVEVGVRAQDECMCQGGGTSVMTGILPLLLILITEGVTIGTMTIRMSILVLHMIRALPQTEVGLHDHDHLLSMQLHHTAVDPTTHLLRTVHLRHTMYTVGVVEMGQGMGDHLPLNSPMVVNSTLSSPAAHRHRHNSSTNIIQDLLLRSNSTGNTHRLDTATNHQNIDLRIDSIFTSVSHVSYIHPLGL